MPQDKYKATQDELDAFDYVNSLPGMQQEIPDYQSYPSAIARGVTKGILSLGQGAGDPVGLLVGESGEELPPEEAWKLYEKLKEEQTQDLQDVLSERLPIGSKLGPRLVERGTKAATESVPNMIFGGPIATPVRAAIGGGAAEIAKDLGVGEVGQGLVEMGAQVAPDFGKNLVSRGIGKAASLEKSLIDEARRLGYSDKEIALLINQRGLTKDFLQMVAPKGGRIAERFTEGRSAIDRGWNALRSTPEAQTVLSDKATRTLIQEISDQVQKLPYEQTKLLEQDWVNLLGSKMKGTDLMDFWRKITYNVQKGERALGTLKKPMQKAIDSISPSLGRDFNLTNTLHGNFYKLAERLKPNLASSLVDYGEAGSLLTGLITGNYPLLYTSIGVKAARQLAGEMVTNPRFMNLGSKMINAIERNSPQLAKQIQHQLILELGKSNAEAAMKLSEADMDEIFKALEENEKND